MGKSEIPTMIVRHRGFFDQPDVVRTIQDWLDENNYLFNIIFKEKTGIIGYDYFILIEGGKNVTDYIKFEFKVLIRINGYQKVEMIKEGNKIKTGEGSIQVEITPSIEADWQQRFAGSKSKFIKALGEFLEKRILKYKIEDHYTVMLIKEENDLASTIRAALGQEL